MFRKYPQNRPVSCNRSDTAFWCTLLLLLPAQWLLLSYGIYLNAWLTSFVGYALLCSLLGWTTRGRHHTPISVFLTVWPLHWDFSLLLCEKWSGFFYVHRVWLSYTRDWRLKVSSERLGNEDKAPCQRVLLPPRDLNSCGTSSMEIGGSTWVQIPLRQWLIARYANVCTQGFYFY